MAEIGAHGRGQREVLRSGAGIARAREGQAKPELRVVVAGASLDDAAEIAGRRRVLAGVELSTREGFEYAPRPRLGGSGPLEQLGGSGRAAPAEQGEATFIELMGVSAVHWNRIWSIL